MLALLLSLLASAQPTDLPEVDLDGDGKPERIKASKQRQLHIGKHELDCWEDDGGCTLLAADLSAQTPAQELQVCVTGPRDHVWCQLHRQVGDELVVVALGKQTGAERIDTNGSGFVYAHNVVHRLFERTDKYVWRDDALHQVPQPIYSAPKPYSLAIDRTFDLHTDVKSDALVGRARPGSAIQILGQHGTEDEWLLVRLSSGITGWVSVGELAGASDFLQSLRSAG